MCSLIKKTEWDCRQNLLRSSGEVLGDDIYAEM